MIILGLTGSIGMGKSTAASQFVRLGAVLFDADSEVHDMMRQGGEAVQKVKAVFPEAVSEKGVDRKKLGDMVFQEESLLETLEETIHPLVRFRLYRFLKRAQRQKVKLVVLDVPLLFETGMDALCDATVVVAAPAFIQRTRVKKRSGIDEDRLQRINAQQMPMQEKIRRADFVIKTGNGKRHVYDRVKEIIKIVTETE